MRKRTAFLAAALVGGLALSGCKINPKEAEYYPKVTGNTYELQNDLAIVLPVAERINVSYEFVQIQDKKIYLDADERYEGPIWWYQERTAEIPEQFLAIHLMTLAEAYEEPSGGQLVKLSRTSFNAYDYCLDLSADEIPPEVAPYIESLLDEEFPVSTDLFVRRYTMRDVRETEDGGRERTDVIYVRDVVRLGYTCDGIGDLRDPGPSSQEIVTKLRTDSQAAFEVMS